MVEEFAGADDGAESVASTDDAEPVASNEAPDVPETPRTPTERVTEIVASLKAVRADVREAAAAKWPADPNASANEGRWRWRDAVGAALEIERAKDNDPSIVAALAELLTSISRGF